MQFLTIYKWLQIGRCLMLQSCKVAKLRFSCLFDSIFKENVGLSITFLITVVTFIEF